jgi:hypothetical protein
MHVLSQVHVLYLGVCHSRLGTMCMPAHGPSPASPDQHKATHQRRRHVVGVVAADHRLRGQAS